MTRPPELTFRPVADYPERKLAPARIRPGVQGSYRDMVAAFGEPRKAEKDGPIDAMFKISTAWFFESGDGRFFEVHDWKCTSLWEEGCHSPQRFRLRLGQHWKITAADDCADFRAWLRAEIRRARELQKASRRRGPAPVKGRPYLSPEQRRCLRTIREARGSYAESRLPGTWRRTVASLRRKGYLSDGSPLRVTGAGIDALRWWEK